MICSPTDYCYCFYCYCNCFYYCCCYYLYSRHFTFVQSDLQPFVHIHTPTAESTTQGDSQLVGSNKLRDTSTLTVRRMPGIKLATFLYLLRYCHCFYCYFYYYCFCYSCYHYYCYCFCYSCYHYYCYCYSCCCYYYYYYYYYYYCCYYY